MIELTPSKALIELEMLIRRYISLKLWISVSEEPPTKDDEDEVIARLAEIIHLSHEIYVNAHADHAKSN